VFLEDLGAVPVSVLQTLRRQLGLSGPDQIADYVQGVLPSQRLGLL
jgi:hypothetical protein